MSVELADTKMSPTDTAATGEGAIDEGLYSRQLYVLGFEAMRRMLNSNVLVIGMRGLGVEVAKNVALAGVRSLTIWDRAPVSSADLSAQFFLTERHIGKPRDSSSLPSIAALNEYVPVRVLDGEDVGSVEQVLTVPILSQFQVVILTDATVETRLLAGRVARQANCALITANVRGLFAAVFCDFGPSFVVTDVTGEPPLTGLIASISEDGLVTCSDETRHGLEDTDKVVLREVKGWIGEALNDCTFAIKVVSPHSFQLLNHQTTTTGGDPSTRYQHGSGVFEQVKQPKAIAFKSLDQAIQSPDFIISDFAKMDRQELLHQLFLQPTVTVSSDLSEEMVRVKNEFDRQEAGYIAPMCAVIGGIVAQEVIKACTGKFHPIQQFLYFDSLESLPSVPTDTDSLGSRYDCQIAVFGQAFQRRLAELRGFVVGAGAIGCELLKVFALMGVSGGTGLLTVTDMDNIEKSNLNRQFLFRPKDVGKAKSVTAAQAIAAINPSVKVDARCDRVGPETENLFNDDFFDKLDFVANALDNVDARRYMDRRCVYHRKPLLESGTLGTKGNTQVVIPHLTESYSSSNDPPERSIPFCTLHNFPNSIEHTTQWAMDLFHGCFKNEPEVAKKYCADPQSFIANLEPAQVMEQGEVVVKALGKAPSNFEDCLEWGRCKFEELFANNIKQLLYNFPADSLTSTGTPFWSGPKRAPHPLVFSVDNATHYDFVVNAALLRAHVYNVPVSVNDTDQIKAYIGSVAVPEFIPRSGVKIQVNENEPLATTSTNCYIFTYLYLNHVEEVNMDSIKEQLKTVNSQLTLHPVDFEKDDDSNHHIDFVTACANLRADNYDIAMADRHRIKGIAGKIIPAIATTTAMVAGLVGLELYKVAHGVTDLEAYKNFFANLALPFFAFSTPIAAPRASFDGGKTTWTLWDRFDISHGRTTTLTDLLHQFEQEHGLKVSMLSHGSSMLFGFIRKPEELQRRLSMPLVELVESVTKRPVAGHVRAIVLEALAERLADGEDVDIPYIRVTID